MRGKNFEGLKFAKLFVVQKQAGSKPTRYLCRCECGNEVIIRYSGLTSGQTKSCGCIRSEACKLREKRKNHPDYGRVKAYYKRNAKVRKISWELEDTLFVKLISGDCFYCKEAPKKRTLVGKEISYNGIDRLDSTLGYTERNCVSCCETCNRAKLAMTVSEFREWVKRVYLNISKTIGYGHRE